MVWIVLARTASSYRRRGVGEAGGGAEDEDEGIGGGADVDDEGRGLEGEEDEDGSVGAGVGKDSVRKSVCLPSCFPDSRNVTLSSAWRLRRDESKDANVDEDGGM